MTPTCRTPGQTGLIAHHGDPLSEGAVPGLDYSGDFVEAIVILEP